MSDVSGIQNLGIPGMSGFNGGQSVFDQMNANQAAAAAANNAAYWANQQNVSNYAQSVIDQNNANWARTNPASGYGQVGGYPSFGDPAAPGTYSPGSGLSSFSGAPLSAFDTGAHTSYDPNAPFGGGYVGASSSMGTNSGNFNTSGYFNANPDALDIYKNQGAWGFNDPTQFAEAHMLAAHNNPGENGAWRSGWAPTANTDFNTAGYYQANPDALAAFASSGFQDPTAFAEQHLKAAYNNPADHSIRGGWGTDNPDFNAAGYYQANPDAWAAFAGSNVTDPTAFAEQHLKAAYNNPADRSMRTGWEAANPNFDTAGYYAANPDAWQAYAAGGWGANANDPTAFAETHLNAAHAAEGGNWRGGWQLASNDPNSAGGLAYAPEGWTSPYGSKGGLSPIGEIRNNPYAAPPGADISNPSSYWYPSEGDPNQWEISRAPYTTQLANDKDRMYQMAARISLELSNPQDSQGRQAIAEAMFNRNAARGLDPLDPQYFPHDVVHDPRAAQYLADYANKLATLKNDPQLLGQIYGEIGLAAAGSNLTQGATDWGSLGVADKAAKYATETYKSPIEGERFFRRDLSNSDTGPAAAKQIQDWYNSMLNWQPQ
jgi:hypothetical protein